MQFIDLATQQQRIRERIEANIRAVLDHGHYIMGPEIGKLEQTLAEYVGTKHALACASGTDALLLALMAYGVGPGDAILTTPFTFIATAEVISLLGATPVFVDIDARTYNLDPAQVKRAIQALQQDDSTIYPLPAHTAPLTPKGIIPVDLFGLPADYNQINALAKQHQILVIEDAAQSFGADYHGKKACALADVACTSFFPAKPLGCYGDGGMCFTDDDRLIEIMRSLRVHGQGRHKYENVRIGLNGRLDTLQAAILLAKFEIFPEEIDLRQQVARRYTELLAPWSAIVAPQIPENLQSVWAQYSLLAQDQQARTTHQERLKQAGIPTAIYYPMPLHLQPAFTALDYSAGAFPVSEYTAQRIFSIPMHPYLIAQEQEQIASILNK
jgi:UDP-2-acetamido-2-deoxy-ribo-hexuluronate aminotransferase